jgi:hypothetical protein
LAEGLGYTLVAALGHDVDQFLDPRRLASSKRMSPGP